MRRPRAFLTPGGAFSRPAWEWPRLAAAWLVALALGLGLPTLCSAGPSIPCTDASAVRAGAVRTQTWGRISARFGEPPDSSHFVLFGWVSPPADSTTEARIAEMADMGLNLALPAWLDEGCPDDNLARLDWAAAHGMRCLVWDSRLNGAIEWLPTFEDTLNQIVAEYRDHPGLWGYYLGDEPPESLWPLLARLRASLRERDPSHPGWNTLLGRGAFGSAAAMMTQLRDYSATFAPAVLSADHYDFRTGGDYGQFVENLSALRTVADERGLPFWNIIQLIPHANIRPLSHGEMRWQVSHSLAFGASGIGYFTYWTPDPDPYFDWQPAIIDHEGQRTEWYDFLRDFNAGVRITGELLTRAYRVRTVFAGSVPLSGQPFVADDWIAVVEGRAAIGEFWGPAGERWMLVANSDSLAARTIVLTTVDSRGARLVASGAEPTLTVEPNGLHSRLTLALAAGDFVLLELDRRPGRQEFRIAPNPAAGRIRFSVLPLTAGQKFQVFDLRGRAVWSTRVHGTQDIEWDGRDLEGRLVPPGVYFARLPGFDFGVPPTVHRFVWLGGR